MANTEVRSALAHAINRQNIVSSIYNNKYKVTDYSLDYGSWLKGESGDNSYNPELAKQVLEQNGWEFKYNRWQKTENYYTRTLTFKLVVQATNQARVSAAEMIKNIRWIAKGNTAFAKWNAQFVSIAHLCWNANAA